MTARCVYTGEPIFEVARDPNLAEEDQMHFNPRAFTMAQPFSATVGNFGNVPNGILRQPAWWNWDVTLARRFSVPQLGRNAQVRLQLQVYNIFNSVQFTSMNTNLQFQDDPAVPGLDNLLLTSTNHGRYTAAIPPRQFGITVRLRILTRRVRPTAHASSACAVGAFCFPTALPGRPERLARLDELNRHFGHEPLDPLRHLEHALLFRNRVARA